jgi:flagellar motor switch protein FliG
MVLTGREKATIFLSIIGADNSARILRYLPNELADLIASGINHLPSPSTEALSEVMHEFKSFLALPSSEEADVPQIAEKPRPAAPRLAYNLLMYERPQMVAFLLSLMTDDAREEALQSQNRDKKLLQELLKGLKKNLLSDKLADALKEQYRGKLFI